MEYNEVLYDWKMEAKGRYVMKTKSAQQCCRGQKHGTRSKDCTEWDIDAEVYGTMCIVTEKDKVQKQHVRGATRMTRLWAEKYVVKKCVVRRINRKKGKGN